jgi:hypothetical protein
MRAARSASLRRAPAPRQEKPEQREKGNDRSGRDGAGRDAGNDASDQEDIDADAEAERNHAPEQEPGGIVDEVFAHLACARDSVIGGGRHDERGRDGCQRERTKVCDALAL